MNILFIAPIPPPITGHSIVSKAVLDELTKVNNVYVVNLSKNDLKSGNIGLKRIFDIFRILVLVYKYQKHSAKIYFTISESLAGNLKDLLIYLLCYRKLNETYIHIHGGSIRNLLWDKYPRLFKINKFFLKKVGAILVSGQSHVAFFSDFFPEEKIRIVRNFASDLLFLESSAVEQKFQNLDCISILYVGGLIKQKGYCELAQGFLDLPVEIRQKCKLSFAGKFESEEAELKFRDLCRNENRISYHGLVDEGTKAKLFKEAHIFCLPTAYLEGQPISILEAYASGCVVLTTSKPGILDIFECNINGYLLNDTSGEAVKKGLLSIIDRSEKLSAIAVTNANEARSTYTRKKYTEAVLAAMYINRNN